MSVYALTIFIGAFLLFQVQPLIGKYILPWFGGGPGVWTTCLLFFQVLLLGGYAYAHLLTRRLAPRRQAMVHLGLLVAAVALLPITPAPAWKPHGDGDPTLQILLLLAACLGVPYFVLSTTGPLLQHWFSRAHPGASPYRLYALSNAGSLLALASYPFFFETHFTRNTQAGMWGWGLAAYMVCCGWCATRLWKSKVQSPKSKVGNPKEVRSPKSEVRNPCTEVPLHASPLCNPAAALSCEGAIQLRTSDFGLRTSFGFRPTTPSPLLWLLLPACASVLLLAVTNKLCQDVAVVPFLWVAPLALYLLSFVICFDSPRWYKRFPFALALIAAQIGLCWALSRGADWPLWKQVAVYCGGLFICCMVCHGELYRLRPEPERLTGFYLLIAAGGALGGLFVAVAAPLLFTHYYELHCGLFLCGLLFAITVQSPGVAVSSQSSVVSSEENEQVSTSEPQATEKGLSVTQHATRNTQHGLRITHPLRRRDSVASHASRIISRYGPALGCLALWFGVGALGMALWRQVRQPDSERVFSTRNFYGVLTVYEHRPDEPDGHHFLLQHGRITHGLQFVDTKQASWPTTYYGAESGVGLALNALPAGHRRIGLVGLGTGTLTAYAKPGDAFRIYEINPAVTRLASSRFTYLSNCQGKVEIAAGDARLSLEREAPQQFDLLALDAFSSDAIPVHLLTQEAFALYGRHLKTNGVLAVHISNHYLDLEPVVVNLARRFDYKLAKIDYDETNKDWWLYSSTWLLLTHNKEFLSSTAISAAASPACTPSNKVPLWTDNFASLFQILK